MLYYIEAITLLICGYFIAREVRTTVDGKSQGWFSYVVFLIFIVALFYFLKTLSTILAHVYAVVILIATLDLVGKRISKNKTAEKEKISSPKSSYSEFSIKKRYQGINRPEPQEHLMNLGSKDAEKHVPAPAEEIISNRFNIREKESPRKFIKNSNILNVAFSYIDSNDEYTYREVDVKKVDKEYISGYCHLRSRVRTFRLDRIQNDEIVNLDSGEILDVEDWLKSLPRSIKGSRSGRK